MVYSQFAGQCGNINGAKKIFEKNAKKEAKKENVRRQKGVIYSEYFF
jgi:hypothetical protein